MMRRKHMAFILMATLVVLALASGLVEAAAKTKIVFWHDSDEISEFTENTLYKLVDEYNQKNPKVAVQIMKVVASGSPGSSGGVGAYGPKLMSSLATGIGPDIFWYYDADMSNIIRAGYCDPVPKYVLDNMKKNGIYQWVLDALSMDGTARGVPHDVMWGAMLYNKNIFREVGLNPEVGPKTWDDLIQYSLKLSKWDANGRLTRSGYNVRFHGGFVGIADKWAHFLLSAGENILDKTGTKATFNSPAGIDALNLYVDLVNKYKVDSVDFPRDIEAFCKGYTAMIGPREAFMVSYVKEYGSGLDLGTAYMPAKTRHASSGAIRMIVVNSKSKVKKQAWAFLDWLNQPAQARRMYVDNRQLPAYEPLAKDPVYNDPDFRAWVTHPNVITRMTSVRLGEVYPILGRAIQAAVYQKQTVKAALDDAAAEVNKLLNK